MDFVKITDDFVQEEEQVDDVGFIENNKFYNTMSSNSTIQNKRVFPPQKLLDDNKNLGVKSGSIYNPNPNFIEKQQAEKKKVTYDDILSSLNMKVINGKLQIVRGDTDTYSTPPQNLYNKNRIGNTTPKNMNMPNNAYAKQNEFYNKFLQAQTQVQAHVVAETLTPVVPFTPEEKKRILMMQYIKQQQERQHISRVKSRKLNFV